jgi:urease accessory protein
VPIRNRLVIWRRQSSSMPTEQSPRSSATVSLCGRVPTAQSELARRPARIGIRGPAGAGKTRLIGQLIPRLCALGLELAVIAHDEGGGEAPASDRGHDPEGARGAFPLEPQNAVRLRQSGRLDPARVMTAVSSGEQLPEALRRLLQGEPAIALLLIESDGEQLRDSPLLRFVDRWIYVVDAARASALHASAAHGGETVLDFRSADVLVVNKIDVAPYLGVDLARTLRALDGARQGRPTLLTNCESGDGVEAVLAELVQPG